MTADAAFDDHAPKGPTTNDPAAGERAADSDAAHSDAADSDAADELAGRVPESELAHLHSVEAMASEKPWMRELALQTREHLTVRAEHGDRLVERRRERLRRGGSATISIRLSPEDLYALERRAAFIGITPSMLARNLIRSGTADPSDRDLIAPLAVIEDAVARLRRSLSAGRRPREA